MTAHKLRITCRIYTEDGERTVELSGRNAQTLQALITSGVNGITALEMSCWAYRLAAYIHILKHQYGLDITTLREPHEGGHHGRYILHSAVEILEVYDSEAQPV